MPLCNYIALSLLDFYFYIRVLEYSTVYSGAGSTRRYCLYDSYYPLKSRFATALVFKRNSNSLERYDGRSSLHRMSGTLTPIMTFRDLFAKGMPGVASGSVSHTSLAIDSRSAPPIQAIIPPLQSGKGRIGAKAKLSQLS